jgi:AMP nucleosidase
MTHKLSSCFHFVSKARFFDSAVAAVDYASEIYHESVERIKSSFDFFMLNKERDLEQKGFYPYIGLIVEQKDLSSDHSLSYGVVLEPGAYGTTITRPDLFKSYYCEQLSLLMLRHKCKIIVGVSDSPIPLSYLVDHSIHQVNDDQLWVVKNGFVLPNLSRINDNVPNGKLSTSPIKPLSLFSAERMDYSLHRLYHYTGTSCEHFQGFVLLTNYQRYIDAFIHYGQEMIAKKDGYVELIGPGNQDPRLGKPSHLPQMPAYHLKREDGNGITFINIGVGPSNAKNITDHLAVLRPHCWLMVGHCAGLRSTQVLGDYVLAHGYVREDRVMDQDLPNWIPIPAIAEIQVALQKAVENITLDNDASVKQRLRTGTVLTTDNRNWELRSCELYERFQQSRAIAVDMESATIAANGFRFRVPYGTILCVSDKPIHGEIKLQGMANSFYRKRVDQHLLIGLEAVRLLREEGDSLHSRKLRGFDDPPFR